MSILGDKAWPQHAMPLRHAAGYGRWLLSTQVLHAHSQHAFRKISHKACCAQVLPQRGSRHIHGLHTRQKSAHTRTVHAQTYSMFLITQVTPHPPTKRHSAMQNRSWLQQNRLCTFTQQLPSSILVATHPMQAGFAHKQLL